MDTGVRPWTRRHYGAGYEGHTVPCVGVLYSPVFDQVVSLDARVVNIWDPATGAKATSFHVPQPVSACAWDKMEARVLTGSVHGVFNAWNYTNGTFLKHFAPPENSNWEIKSICYIVKEEQVPRQTGSAFDARARTIRFGLSRTARTRGFLSACPTLPEGGGFWAGGVSTPPPSPPFPPLWWDIFYEGGGSAPKALTKKVLPAGGVQYPPPPPQGWHMSGSPVFPKLWEGRSLKSPPPPPSRLRKTLARTPPKSTQARAIGSC